eukprot:jgi/Tetstr1/448471/TSEL_035739.t1
MVAISANYDEPQLFCEHLALWRYARRGVIYDAGATLFRPADFAGKGSATLDALREALKSCKWCFFGIGEIDDLLVHVGPAKIVKQEAFCDAFCRFVASSIKPKPNNKTTRAELPVRSRLRQRSEPNDVCSRAPALGRATAVPRRAASDSGTGAMAPSEPSPTTRHYVSFSASPMTSARPSSPESLPPVASRSEGRLPVFMKAARGRHHSSAASVCSAQNRNPGATSCISVSSTRSKHGVIRSSQVVGGNAALNMRSNSSAFRATRVTKKSMKEYFSIFKGMTVSSSRTVSMADFETHMARAAPDLLPYAQRMYTTACKRGSKAANELNFESMLRVLLPSATKADVHELMEMVMDRTTNNGPTPQQVDDANTIFKLWNKSGDNLLTFDEMEHGLEAMNVSEEDMDEWLEQLFGVEGTPDCRTCVSPGDFKSWFTRHAGELSL